MSPPTDTYMLLRAFVDELARCGMRAACTSPGSRSAPLVLSLVGERRLRCYSHVDERCAGFFALGLAKATGVPVAVACTSGTAAAELLPAAVEAREARVPLLLLTADRPAELRDNGAGQAIDQLGLFGSAAKWFVEVAVHEAGERELRWIRTLACRAFWTALEGRPGVVHLNFPLREPLVGELDLPADATGRAMGAPYVARPPAAAGAAAQAQLAELLGGARRGVVVAGRHERSTPLGEAASAFAQAAGWPLLADPMSGARRGGAAVAHYDALLRDEAFAGAIRPDAVLRVGDLPVSKPLRAWLASLEGVPQTALDPDGAWQDPDAALAESLPLEPAGALASLAAAGVPGAADPDWLQEWTSADERAAAAIDVALRGGGGGTVGGTLGEQGRAGGRGEALSEPVIARELGVLLPAVATLFVASSMPVRDIETFWPVREDPPRVLCNRGANGIDGTVSAAFGAAAANRGPVVLLIGDVTLAHDIGGLLAARRLGVKLTIVLLDNDGGGIFDFLPISRTGAALAADPSAQPGTAGGALDIYSRHVLTPTGVDFSAAAAAYGLGYERPADARELRGALEQTLAADTTGVVHVCTDRGANVRLHRRVWDDVAAALSR
ncbi:MAG TPA: 2-succinyl-5-enolpyruvyl-6-hydroxy-3-cyclohexene-1-carboxylic-acid synthase [Solirubrobacteraceae bacterium]|nr:2-succinyl-5-enolpyruvyl-6-hydroxy-3-cyclohexene-1-carboxylic-acid synthase [Solirubrobacteraceae bacterium]